MRRIGTSSARPERSADGNIRAPVVGITMGDAAGVGPEIIMKALGHPEVYELCRPIVIGDAGRLRRAGEIVGALLSVNRVAAPAAAAYRHGAADCIDLALVPEDLPFGRLSPVAGNAAYHYVARAVELALAGEIQAICTAPLNKEALHAAGHVYPG